MPEGEGTGGQGPVGTLAGGGVNQTDTTEWRGRALQAEEKAKELDSILATLKTELATAQQTLDAMKRRREVEHLLVDAKAADVETALLLVEQSLAQKPGIDVGQAVADVKSRKPALFHPPEPPHAPVGAAAQMPEPYAAAVDQAFTRASAARGNRKSLLGYLRAKRGV
ncbi:MAG: hypothetical protein AABZ53_06915 [Planctomycetota bacterium]